jgi:formate dehydrogenase subunit delta
LALKQIEHLVKMANQIAINTGARIDEELAARRTGEHIRKFWTPAMRNQLLTHWRSGGDGLDPVVVSALDAFIE